MSYLNAALFRKLESSWHNLQLSILRLNFL